MTDPLLDDPFEGPRPRRRRVIRELIGLILVLIGAVTLLWVLIDVDWRAATALVAAAMVGGGLYLASGRDGES